MNVKFRVIRQLLISSFLLLAMVPAGAVVASADTTTAPGCPGGDSNKFPIAISLSGRTIQLGSICVNETAHTFDLVVSGSVVGSGTFAEQTGSCVTTINYSGHFTRLPSLIVTGTVSLISCGPEAGTGTTTLVVPGVGTLTIGFVAAGGSFVPISFSFTPAASVGLPGDD